MFWFYKFHFLSVAYLIWCVLNLKSQNRNGFVLVDSRSTHFLYRPIPTSNTTKSIHQEMVSYGGVKASLGMLIFS